jgi:RNA polymerase sigma-70 factor (ECF subfamily)
MAEASDIELLRDYCRQGSEEALPGWCSVMLTSSIPPRSRWARAAVAASEMERRNKLESRIVCSARADRMGKQMPASTTHPSETAKPQSYFATTHWSVVVSAGRSDTPRARHALERLCQTYWYPLYAYVRRRGYSAHDAQDLTQGFFTRLLEGGSLAAADPARGRFRSFMLTALNHFLMQEWEKARAQRRGRGREVLSLDLAAAENRYELEPATGETPDREFDRKWALTLLDEVMNRLEREYGHEGKAPLFDALKATLAGSREAQPYRQLAAELEMSEGAVKVAVHRLRKRYRALLQAEIASTVTTPEEAREEMRYLWQALSS